MSKLPAKIKFEDKKNPLPRGITVRRSKNSLFLQIAFSYKGVQCRENAEAVLNSKNEITSKCIKDAYHTKIAVDKAIEKNAFSYSTFFEKSPKAKFFDPQEYVNPLKITFDSIIEDLIKFYESQLVGECPPMKKSSVITYNRILKNEFKPFIGHLEPIELTTNHIKNYIKANRTITKKTMSNRMIVLRALIDKAINMEIITHNIMGDISLNHFYKQVRLPKSKYKVIPFKEEEINILLSKCTGNLHNLIKFNMNAGLRMCELIALEWNDINFDTGFITVNKGKPADKIESTKTEAGDRKVLMLPGARAALLSQFEISGKNKYIFNNPNTNKPWNCVGKLSTHWKNLLDSIPELRYRVCYQMRHSYCSKLKTGGENKDWMATQLGHVKGSMMIDRIYGQFLDSEKYQLKGNY